MCAAVPGMGANGADRLNDCQRSPRREACGAAVRGRTDGFMKIAGGSESGKYFCKLSYKILACFLEKPCDLPGNTGNCPTTDDRPWLGHQNGGRLFKDEPKEGDPSRIRLQGLVSGRAGVGDGSDGSLFGRHP